jgi:molybdopterin/thiamine biosynthesis adenylyltransferase
MAHIFQVGVGSGGMVVLDLLARDERIHKITIVDPDVYQPHNIQRHYFSDAHAGQRKVSLAQHWVGELRPDLEVLACAYDLTHAAYQTKIEAEVAQCDIGICAVDSEPAKFHFDALMRKYNKPWTLGEVLSGGIGGWVHLFKPDGACYGCVASHLQRSVQTDKSPPPDYANPEAALAETRIPASKASITAIASLHANLTLDLLAEIDPGFTSMLLPLAKVDGVFDDAYRPYRFRIARSAECLICGLTEKHLPAGEELDVALDQALSRLGNE